MSRNILVVATSYNGKLTNSDLVTGSWVEEIASPYYVWKLKGWHVELACIQGGEVPFDPASKEGDFCTEQAGT